MLDEAISRPRDDELPETGEEERGRMSDTAYELYRQQYADSNGIRRSIQSIFLIGMGFVLAGYLNPTTNFNFTENRIFIPGFALLGVWAAMTSESHYCEEIVAIINRGLDAEKRVRPVNRFYDLINAKFGEWSLTMHEVVYVMGAILWIAVGLAQHGM